jgi:hypothetical protein
MRGKDPGLMRILLWDKDSEMGRGTFATLAKSGKERNMHLAFSSLVC